MGTNRKILGFKWYHLPILWWEGLKVRREIAHNRKYRSPDCAGENETTKFEELNAAHDAANDAAGEAFDVALDAAFESGLDNQATFNAAFDAYDAAYHAELNKEPEQMFSEMGVVAVDDGTEIECDGEKLVVSASKGVIKGRTFYVSHTHFALLKANSNIVEKGDHRWVTLH